MLMGVRMYANEQNARDAAAKLVEAELLDERQIFLFTPGSGGAEEVVEKALQEKTLPGSHARKAVEALGKGQAVLSIVLPLRGTDALEIMDSCGAVDTGPEPVHYHRDPSPFSDAFGIPVLTKGESRTRLLSGPKDSSFGFPTLKKSGSIDSSFGFPTLKKSASKDSSFGLPLLSKNGTPLSSMFGLKTLTGRKK